MRYEIINCEQNSPEWFEARKGMPTSSRFKDVLAQGEGKVRGKYMRQLAGEQLTGRLMKTYSNERMEEGHEKQPWMQKQYSFDCEVSVDEVGFIKMNPELCFTGCSPDGLIGQHGMVEFKSTSEENMIAILDAALPPVALHQPQIQGGLWITERKWCDLVYGCPDLPLKIIRISRDEPFIGRLINELKMFNIELKRLVERIRDI